MISLQNTHFTPKQDDWGQKLPPIVASGFHARMRSVVATSCHNISASAGAGFKRAVCPLPAHLCFLGLSLAASFWAERAEHQASLKSTLHYEL